MSRLWFLVITESAVKLEGRGVRRSNCTYNKNRIMKRLQTWLKISWGSNDLTNFAATMAIRAEKLSNYLLNDGDLSLAMSTRHQIALHRTDWIYPPNTILSFHLNIQSFFVIYDTTKGHTRCILSHCMQTTVFCSLPWNMDFGLSLYFSEPRGILWILERSFFVPMRVVTSPILTTITATFSTSRFQKWRWHGTNWLRHTWSLNIWIICSDQPHRLWPYLMRFYHCRKAFQLSSQRVDGGIVDHYLLMWSTSLRNFTPAFMSK